MDTEEKVPQEGQPVAPQAPKRKQMSPARKSWYPLCMNLRISWCLPCW